MDIKPSEPQGQRQTRHPADVEWLTSLCSRIETEAVTKIPAVEHVRIEIRGRVRFLGVTMILRL